MVSHTSNAANAATAVPIRTSTVMALLSSKLNSHGVAMSHSPATKLNHFLPDCVGGQRSNREHRYQESDD